MGDQMTSQDDLQEDQSLLIGGEIEIRCESDESDSDSNTENDSEEEESDSNDETFDQ